MSRVRRFSQYLIPSVLIIIVTVSSLAVYAFYSSGTEPKASPDVYVGVAFGGNTTAEARALIDRVNGYTNLFILDAGRNPISRNQTSVEEVCDYAVSKGLSVIVNMGIDVVDNKSASTWFWQQPINETKQRWTERWGNKFLGIYYNDEPGGIQLDGDWGNWFRRINGENLNKIGWETTNDLYQVYLKLLDSMVNGTQPQNYDLEANFFVNGVVKSDPGLAALDSAGIPAYTSDYGLYWFDYLGGYNVLFTELGWNCSVAEQIALVKGAARLQNKEWGAMITWKYNETPYLDSGDQIYNQMLTSYQAGAKYIAVFDYPYDSSNNYGTITGEPLIAIERFWKDVTQKKFNDLSTPQAVFVLPKNYGWGMRYPNDTIWGFWPTDYKTQQIAMNISELLAKSGVSLDIVYADSAYPITNVGYQNVYYWNQTAIQ
jgi:hypothetical protein